MRQHRRTSPRLLRTVLLLRVLWNAAFAVYLLVVSFGSIEILGNAFGWFALADGALALVMACAYVVVSPGRMLWLSPAIDVVTRSLLVMLALGAPGLSVLPPTAFRYVRLIATFALTDGALDLAEGLTLRRAPDRRPGWLPLALGGATVMIIGAALFVADADTRGLRTSLAALSAVQAIVLASALRYMRDVLAPSRVVKESPVGGRAHAR